MEREQASGEPERLAAVTIAAASSRAVARGGATMTGCRPVGTVVRKLSHVPS